MPDLLPSLELCEILSARGGIIARFCSVAVNETWTRVIDVGDAECECLALLKVMRSGPPNQLGTRQGKGRDWPLNLDTSVC